MYRFLTDSIPIANTLKEHKGYALSVTVDSAREMYQTAIGAHPDQSGFVRLRPRPVVLTRK